MNPTNDIYPHKIIGYKKLIPYKEYGKFSSPAFHGAWENFQLTAHMPPESGQLHGINAYFEPTNPSLCQYKGILVELELSGKVLIGTEGCRAEKARITGFSIIEYMAYFDLWTHATCESCEILLPKTEMQNFGKMYYCEDCFTDAHFMCAICHAPHHIDDSNALQNHDEILCNVCYNQYSYNCPECGAEVIYHYDFDLCESYSTSDDYNIYCSDECFYSVHTYCERCDEDYPIENVMCIDDRYLCEYCAEEENWKCDDCEKWTAKKQNTCEKKFCYHGCEDCLVEESYDGLCLECAIKAGIIAYCPDCHETIINLDDGEETCARCWLIHYTAIFTKIYQPGPITEWLLREINKKR